ANPLYVPPNTSEKHAKESKEHSNADLFALEIFQEPIETDDDEEEEPLSSDNDDKEELAITQSSQSIPGTPSPRKVPLPTSPASPTPRRIPLPTSPVSLTPRRIPLPTSPLNSTPRRIPLPDSDNEDSDATVSDVDEEKGIAEVSVSTNRAEIHDIHDVSLGSSKRTSNLNASGSSEDNEIHQFNLKTLTDEKINLFLKDDDPTGSSTSTVSATTPESSPSKATPRRSMPKSISSSRKLLFKNEIDAINK
ncbi:29490_t:CDS:2, partial [Racocetra persica]